MGTIWDFEGAGKHGRWSAGTMLYAGGSGGQGKALKRGTLRVTGNQSGTCV